MELNGTSAIVSGGASGLGEATARALSRAGAHVVIADLNEDRGKEVAADIGGTFAGTDVTDEESVREAVAAFGRGELFDQDNDSIVRVEANRLRKRLAEYYAGEGAGHAQRITIPVGQYIPVFEDNVALSYPVSGNVEKSRDRRWLRWIALVAAGCLLLGLSTEQVLYRKGKHNAATGPQSIPNPEAAPAYVLADEIRILAGSSRSYADHSGKVWSPDAYYSGGTPGRSSAQHIWRTQDPTIYRTSRQGEFSYDIPLRRGNYELRLHFAETFYGPEEVNGGGEGSRVMNVSANGRSLLTNLDVLADAGAGRTADVRVFSDITPATDGKLHLRFSANGGTAMLSGIEILPGTRGHIRPVRLVARDVPYYSNDSRWWSADTYFKGGQLRSSQQPAVGTDDPELYETERWGHFSYAIPVGAGKYTLVVYFVARRVNVASAIQAESGDENSAESANAWIFDVVCNGKTIVRHLDLTQEAGENHPLVRKISGVEPNAQGKLLLEFVPVSQYATVSAIEVLPE